MSVLVIAREELHFTDSEQYQDERDLAEMEVNSSHPSRQYIWGSDDVKQTISYTWLELFPENKFEDLFYDNPPQDKYTPLLLDAFGDRKHTMKIQYSDYVDFKQLPNAQDPEQHDAWQHIWSLEN